MGKLLRCFLFLCICWFTALAHAQIDAAAAESLMRKSGLWDQLDGMAPQVRAGFAAAQAQFGVRPSQSENDRLSKAIDNVYSVERLRSISVGIIAQGLSAQDVAALQRWFDSPLGRNIINLEDASSDDQLDQQKTLRDGNALLAQMPASRRALIEQLVTETRVADAMVQIAINTGLAVQRGLSKMLPIAPGASPDELKANLEAQRPQMLKAFSALLTASFAKTYAPLSSQELEQYLTFIKSPAGQHFNDVSIKALDAAMVNAAEELGRSLPGTKDGESA